MNEPIKSVLTKDTESRLIQSNRDRWSDIIMGSTSIHELTNNSKIDKNSVVEALFNDQLFVQALGSLLFHSKILNDTKLEIFLQARIVKLTKEYSTDRQIKDSRLLQ